MNAVRPKAPAVREGDRAERPAIERWSWTFVVAVLCLRTILGLHRISLPGLQNDEVLFVNAATIRLPGIFISHTVAGIPVMVFPYTGALKSWIYAPIFSIFGTSPLTIRLPVELITSAALLLLYPAVRDLVNRPVALAAVTFLCFDGSLFWLTRDDVGPTALEFFFKCAGVWAVARYARDVRVRWLLLLLATLALGTFNKLNYTWVVDATLAASIVVAFVYRAHLRRHASAGATWIVGLLILYGCFGLYYEHNHIASLNGTEDPFKVLPHTWPQYVAGIKLVLSGTWFFAYALAPIGARMIVVWCLLATFVGGGAASVLSSRSRSLPVACLALVTLLMAAQTLLTYQATAAWHYVSVYPYFVIVSAYGVWAGATAVLRHRRQALAAIGAAALAASVYDGVLMVRYFQQLSHEPSFSAWSPGIYPLSRLLQHMPGTVFAADWGILTPLLALHQSHRYIDLEFSLVNGSTANLAAVASEIKSTPGPKLILTHTNAKAIFPNNNQNLRVAVGRHLHLIRTVDGDDHVPVFRVYSYR